MPAEAAPALQQARWLGPTGMGEGWHVRLAYAVTNPGQTELLDATAGVDVPLGELLLEAGWAASRKGGALRPESFELDETSIRVVEYRNLLQGSPAGPLLLGEVASRATPGLFDASRPYHNKTQPDLRVEWVLPGTTPAGATRHFYVYADTKGNGVKGPAGHPEAQMGPIDGRYWVSRGTVLYGVASQLRVFGAEDGTTVQVDVYQGARPTPLQVGIGADSSNPRVLNRSEMARYDLGDDARVVRVSASKPVVALGTGPDPNRYGGVVPSLDGGVRGRTFLLPPAGIGAMVLTPDTPAVVTVDADAPVPMAAPGAVGFQTAVLLGDVPPPVHLRPLHVVTADKAVTLLAWPDAPGVTQFPTHHGAPVGSRLGGLPYEGHFCGPPASPNGRPCRPVQEPPCDSENLEFRDGQLVAFSYDNRSQVRGRDLLTGDLSFPRSAGGVVVSRTAKEVTAGTFWRTAVVAEDCPVEVFASVGAEDPRLLEGTRLSAFGGVAGNLVGPLGGVGARRFFTPWDVHVVAFHNGTDVEVRAPGKPALTRGLGASDLMTVDASSDAPVEIRATKPVALLGIEPGAYFAGLDRSLVVERVGKPEYRGWLVSLEPAAGLTEPVVGVAAAGRSATYDLVVRNLAKDELGRGVADNVRLTVDAPAEGWDATLSETSLRLGGGESRTVTLTVTPAADVEEGAPLRISVHAASEGNPAMADHVGVVTVVRAAYAIDAWFDREDGPKARTLTVDPGATQKATVVVKNVAAVPDRVSLAAASLSADWKTQWADVGAELVETDLAPGESRAFSLVVTAPPGNASQSVVEVTATSLGDGAAAEKISATVRVRADIRIALGADEPTVEALPGETARFRVEFHNRGADRVSIRFNATGLLPDGWGPVVTRQGGYVLDELSGIAPGEILPLDVEVPIPAAARHGERAGIQFFVETIPQFVGDPVRRESIDLLALAAQRHDLAVLDAPATLVPDNEGNVRARLVLQNGGNGAENLTVVPLETPRGVGIGLGALVHVPVGERATLPMTLRIAPTTTPGVYPVVAQVVASDGHALPWSFNVTVPERALARLVPLSPARGIAGLDSEVRIEVSNVGNAPLRLPPRLDLPVGWAPPVWEGPLATLEPGASAPFTLRLRAPADAPSGIRALAPDPAWAGGEGFGWDLRTVSLRATLAEDGTGVRVLVSNDGTGDAEDVDVVLLRGDEVVDRATLPRVPAGERTAALLAPREGASDGPLTVLVDNASRYVEQPLSLAVTGAARQEAPAPGLLLACAALALAAVGLRRSRA